ncbi:MarR family transcriptional regulator [Pseudooceanicola sp.]|uniref:MarR family winged helix-turn-helix transcriptional regulator n=1 Tax=Pseudooceanicola sp. TaxID=1914328 RepID=UPI00261F653E|nr:MarR family transcriptional regulator [Pseudooceanicola sp.]MDF1855210.1 MarR family transcriptional regulator [Pseudooceanicola sp.]
MPRAFASVPTRLGAPDRRLRQLTSYSLKRAYHRLQSDAARVLEDLGLRITTYSALAIVCDMPDLRQSQLAEALSMERSNTVVIVDALEQADLIERRRVEHDRRAYALRATAAGRRLCDQATEALHRHEAEMLAPLNDKERGDLMDLLRKLDGGVDGS